MGEKKWLDSRFLSDLNSAFAALDTEDFGSRVICLIRHAGKIHNIGTYFIPNIDDGNPILSVWHGEISDYEYRRFSTQILADTRIVDQIIKEGKEADRSPGKIARFVPDSEDLRSGLFDLTEISETLFLTTRQGSTAFQSFYLRSKRDGEITDSEFEAFEQILPVAHQLIALRHQVIGAELFQFTTDICATKLKGEGVGKFEKLSPREAEACDLMLQGISVAGSALRMKISENSVRTLKKRAYKKLEIVSSSQLSALIINYMRLSKST